MDLRDLRYFETIAELQHLGRASARLHRTQPALSSSIRRLEQDCGAALFERSGRGIRLTAAGHVLLKWAQRMRFDVEDAKRELSDLAGAREDLDISLRLDPQHKAALEEMALLDSIDKR